MATAIHNLSLINRSAAGAQKAPAQSPAANFINRDLSLLEFFRSVLDEGLDESLPLLDRLKFMAIFGSNIDEFFMIRVSALKEKLRDQVEISPDGFTRP